jgi:hypothetical protein
MTARVEDMGGEGAATARVHPSCPQGTTWASCLDRFLRRVAFVALSDMALLFHIPLFIVM